MASDNQGNWVMEHEDVKDLAEAKIISIEYDGKQIDPDAAFAMRPELLSVKAMSGLVFSVVNTDFQSQTWTWKPEESPPDA